MASNSITKAPISDGWHGSQTRIKILPRDFIRNDDTSRGLIQTSFDPDKGGDFAVGIEVSHSMTELYACIPIPTGYKATGLKIGGNDTNNEIWAWIGCCVGCSTIPLFDVTETKVIGTEYDFNGSANTGIYGGEDELVSSMTNYLLVWIELEAAGTDVTYGGYVNIERV